MLIKQLRALRGPVFFRIDRDAMNQVCGPLALQRPLSADRIVALDDHSPR